MDSKLITYELACGCKAHAGIADTAKYNLRTEGYFLKDEALVDAGFQCVGESIRWDLVAKMISEEMGSEIRPVTQSFLNAMAAGVRFPKGTDVTSHIGTGHSKRAVGYVVVKITDKEILID